MLRKSKAERESLQEKMVISNNTFCAVTTEVECETLPETVTVIANLSDATSAKNGRGGSSIRVQGPLSS